MRRLSPAVVSLALVLVSLTPLPAQASHEAVSCTATLVVTFEPGLSITPSKGTFTTGDKPGAMECTGIMQGHEVSGLGSLGITGDYGQSSDSGDTCSLVAGTGKYSVTLPTRDRRVGEQGNFAEVLGPTRQGSFSAVSEDQKTNWTGTFEFSPKQGDCLLSPITTAQLVLQLEGRHASGPDSVVGLSGSSGPVAVGPGVGIDSSIDSSQEARHDELSSLPGLLPLSLLTVDLSNILQD